MFVKILLFINNVQLVLSRDILMSATLVHAVCVKITMRALFPNCPKEIFTESGACMHL